MNRKEPREIDYRIRPAKQTERRMLCDVLTRLDRIRPIRDFRYVGMGSIYFVDFVLLHKLFGIEDMISIEGRDDLIERCLFNCPYDCISVLEREVDSALPELRSDQPTIMWLDYDSPLSQARLEEIRLACVSLAVPSFFVVSVNVHPDNEANRVAEFRRRFGQRDLSRVTEPRHLSRRTLPPLMWSYVNDAINDALRDRTDDAAYQQVVHLRYRDGAEMMTVGGLIYRNPSELTLCDYTPGSLDFIRTDAEPYDLRVPKLTYRERKAIDRLLPLGELAKLPITLDENDLQAYTALYRHAPFYVDVHV